MSAVTGRLHGVYRQVLVNRHHSWVTSRPPLPSRSDVEHRFEALLDHSESREQVDRWAAQWVADDHAGVVDEQVWWALTILCGIDLRHGADAPYLHDHEQIADWLAEFRRRCAGRA